MEDKKMANIYKGTLGLIGNTPLVEVTNIEKELGLEAKLLVKLEYFNPAADFWKHWYRSCIYRSSQRLPHHPDNAGDHEC